MYVNTAILHVSKAAGAWVAIVIIVCYYFQEVCSSFPGHIPLKQLCSLLHSPRPPIKACNKQRSTYTSKRVILPKVINAWLINQMHFKAGSWKHSRTCNLAEPRCLGPWFRVCSPSTTPLMKRPVPVTGCRLVLSGFDMFSCNIQSSRLFLLFDFNNAQSAAPAVTQRYWQSCFCTPTFKLIRIYCTLFSRLRSNSRVKHLQHCATSR